MVTGTIAGLASITPAAGSVTPVEALVIGAIAGVLCQWAVHLVKNTLDIDDTLDVFAVHGVGGIFGTLMIAVLGYGSFVGQGVALLAVGLFTVAVTFALAHLISYIYPIRFPRKTRSKASTRRRMASARTISTLNWPGRRNLAALALIFCIGAAHAAPDLVIGGETIAAGERRSFLLKVPAGDADTGTTIPCLGPARRRTRPGARAHRRDARLRVSADHGLAEPAHRARSGRAARHRAHGARRQRARLSRTDHLHLAGGREEPEPCLSGDLAGTLSDRIAAIITTEIIERSDYLIDLHAGDGNEALRPYVYMPETGDAEFDDAARGLALAFGLDTIVIDRAPVTAPDAAGLTDMTAISRGIPAITTETGLLGGNERELVALAERGVRNVLRHLDMLDGSEESNEAVVWLEDFVVVRSPATGVFRPVVQEGWIVAEGARLGTVHDFFGEIVVVNYVVATPPISEGEPTAMISAGGVVKNKTVATDADPAAFVAAIEDETKRADAICSRYCVTKQR